MLLKKSYFGLSVVRNPLTQYSGRLSHFFCSYSYIFCVLKGLMRFGIQFFDKNDMIKRNICVEAQGRLHRSVRLPPAQDI